MGHRPKPPVAVPLAGGWYAIVDCWFSALLDETGSASKVASKGTQALKALLPTRQPWWAVLPATASGSSAPIELPEASYVANVLIGPLGVKPFADVPQFVYVVAVVTRPAVS